MHSEKVSDPEQNQTITALKTTQRRVVGALEKRTLRSNPRFFFKFDFDPVVEGQIERV